MHTGICVSSSNQFVSFPDSTGASTAGQSNYVQTNLGNGIHQWWRRKRLDRSGLLKTRILTAPRQRGINHPPAQMRGKAFDKRIHVTPQPGITA